MTKRLQSLASSLSANKFLDASSVFPHEFNCQTFDQGWEGRDRLLVERDQKCDHAKSKGLEISFAKFCHQLSTRKINLDFSLEQTSWLNIKMVDFAPKRNAFLPFFFFFLHLPSESVWTVGVRWYPDVITKFSRIHRFPQ